LAGSDHLIGMYLAGTGLAVVATVLRLAEPRERKRPGRA
jgi:hypothetical protein